MNDKYISAFIKQATAAGMPQQKIAALLDKAYEIGSRGSVKTAAANYLDQTVTTLLSSAGLNKTASSVAYTNGILKEALDQGATPEQAIEFTKRALYQTSNNLGTMSKLAAIAQNKDYASYAEGFIKSAIDAGMSQQDAAQTLVALFEREKRASGEEMFKQTAAPQGAGPGPESIPPEVLAKLLAEMQQGQGPEQGPEGAPGDQGMSPNSVPPEVLEKLLPLIKQILAQSQGAGSAGMPPGAPMPPGAGSAGMPPGAGPQNA